MEKKTKYITFKDGPLVYKKPSYTIVNNKSGVTIGTIEYHPPWRQYVFDSWNAVWNDSCLKEIITFLGELRNVPAK